MDRALVERARDGDRDAFATLARTSSRQLYAVATLILRDPDRAQDAVQDALLAAWRGIRALRELDAWDAWLRRLVVRSCYRVARRGRSGQLVELHLADDEGRAMPDSSISLADRDQLERGFRRLSVEHRALLVLHYYLGLPQEDAADLLGIPVGTVKSRLHRATKAMRAALEADAREVPTLREPLT